MTRAYQSTKMKATTLWGTTSQQTMSPAEANRPSLKRATRITRLLKALLKKSKNDPKGPNQSTSPRKL